MGIFEAYDKDAIIPVLLDREGNVTEGPGFNVFSVRNAKLATPDRGLFEGMTRRTVIELSCDLGLPCEVRPVVAEELRNSDEIFITSTAGGVMPVTNLDGRIYGNGKPGPITIRIGNAYLLAKPSRGATFNSGQLRRLKQTNCGIQAVEQIGNKEVSKVR